MAAGNIQLMNRLLLLVGFCNAGLAQGQLFNGSFEQAGVPSLEGWEWTCDEPAFVNEAPPGAGAWSVTKHAGQAKGCFPSYLYQRLSDVLNGDVITVSGWVRCDDDMICVGGWFGLGTINSGAFHLEEQVGNNQFPWAFLSITDTVELADGDTALLVLSGGLIGGPISPFPAHFDGFSLEQASGIAQAIPQATSRYDAATNSLVIATAERLLSVALFDAAGRALPFRAPIAGKSTIIGLSELPKGIYIAQLRTVHGAKALRFAVDR